METKAELPPTRKGTYMNEEEKDVEWFGERLRERGVQGLEMVWGNYREYFHEIPTELLSQYLSHRPRLLHREALATARIEMQVLENHPFMQE